MGFLFVKKGDNVSTNDWEKFNSFRDRMVYNRYLDGEKIPSGLARNTEKGHWYKFEIPDADLNTKFLGWSTDLDSKKKMEHPTLTSSIDGLPIFIAVQKRKKRLTQITLDKFIANQTAQKPDWSLSETDLEDSFTDFSMQKIVDAKVEIRAKATEPK